MNVKLEEAWDALDAVLRRNDGAESRMDLIRCALVLNAALDETETPLLQSLAAAGGNLARMAPSNRLGLAAVRDARGAVRRLEAYATAGAWDDVPIAAGDLSRARQAFGP